MPAAEQPKSLSAFIQRSHFEIIGEFSAFARTLMPPNSPMTEEAAVYVDKIVKGSVASGRALLPARIA